MKKEIKKKWHHKKLMVCLIMLICLFVSGCGDSSKDQIIVVYDYSDSTEKEYDATNEAMDDLVNSISDFFLDGECGTVEIPDGALGYKRIEVFQTDGKASAGQQKTEDNRLMNIEIYQYNDEFFCKASFAFSEQEYTAKLSDNLSAQVKRLETEGP